MNSEQLRTLVGTVLRDLGEDAVAAGVSVRRARPGADADLVTAALRSLRDDLVTAVARAVREHPDVERAGVHDGVLVVRVTDVSRDRDLAAALVAGSEPRQLRAPDRDFLLDGAAAPVTAEAARLLLGPDVVAYELARAHRPGTQGPLRVEVDAAVRRTPASPLFAVQHAHARAAMITARAAAVGMTTVRDNGASWTRQGAAGALVGSLLELSATVARALRRDEIRLVPAHLEEIAASFDRLEPERRSLPSGDEEVTARHLAAVRLAAATGESLRGGLGLLGVSAPDRT